MSSAPTTTTTNWLTEHQEQTRRTLNHRRFYGTLCRTSALLPNENANFGDEHNLSWISDRSLAAVYWSDASWGTNGEKEGWLSAAVVWQDPAHPTGWREVSYPLGHNVGDSADGEMFGLAAAMKLAKKRVEDGIPTRQVIVFTDARWLLNDIADGKVWELGPDVPDLETKFAAEELFDAARWLAEKGIWPRVEWIKGHGKSVGNKRADKVAKWAVKEQIKKAKRAERAERGLVEKEDESEGSDDMDLGTDEE